MFLYVKHLRPKVITMKILYVRTQFWFNLKSGGSVGHTLGILNGFKKNNCQVKVISNEKFLGIDSFDYFIIPPKLKKFFLGELFYNFYAKKKFKEEILKFKPDFIYHRYTGYTFSVTKIAKDLNIPLILEFNSFDSWKMKYWGATKNNFKKFIQRYLLYNIVKKIENYNLKSASLVLTVSEPIKLDLLKLGIPEERILVNPNGVDSEKFNSEIANTEKYKNLKQEIRIDNNRIIVGFTGTFGEWHGIPQLTEAIDVILENKLFPNIYFLLIGEGKLKSKAEKRIGHYQNVNFLGEIPYLNIQDYLGICDILISPHCPQVDGRQFFGSPTKLFEYMAMGKAIVASNLGQIGEVLEDGKTAILVEPGNVEELVRGILKLAKDKNLREKLGKAAREEVIKKYTWQKNVQRLIEKLNSL